MKRNYETALRLLDIGVTPIPLFYMSRVPTVKWTQWIGSFPSISTVKDWFLRSPRNIAAIIERPFIVIDIDDRDKAGCVNVSGLETLETITRRGRHYWFEGKDWELLDGKHIEIDYGDIITNGKLIASPKSLHPSGSHIYDWNDRTPQVISLGEIIERFRIDVREIEIKEKQKEYAPGAVVDIDNKIELSANRIGIINEIKSHLSTWALVSSIMNFRPGSGRYLKAICAFHDDTNPSFLYDTQTDRCKCMAPHCQAYGINGSAFWMDSINIFAIINNISNQEAIQILRESLV